MKWKPEQREAIRALYRDMSAPLWQTDRLVVWPEAAIPELYIYFDIPLDLMDILVQAKVLVPSIFMAQEPHTPSRQDRLKVKVGSISFLILINASKTI